MGRMIDQTVYLVVSEGRTHRTALLMRVSNNAPRLKPGEITLELRVRVPEALFQRPTLRAEIVVPEDKVSAPTITAEVRDNIALTIEQQLGVKIELHVVEPTRVGD